MSKPAFRPVDAFALLVLTVASIIGINQYAYGLYNHCITIPFIKSLINPELYGDDYLVAEIKYFYSLFLPGCSFLIKLLQSSLPATFFILYSISLYATLAAFFLIALKLFERRDVAYFSTMFLIFSLTTLGQERTVENLLMERTLALPFLLFSFYAFFSKRYNTSALLAGIAFLFHPMSASYVMAMLLACFLYQVVKEKTSRNFLIGAGILVVAVSPVFIMKFINPAPGLSLIHVSQEWIELLRIRSAHHVFPTTWSGTEILQALALVAGFILAWKYKPRLEEHRIVMIFFATLLGLFFIGTVFTEIIPVAVVIQFQVFRSFKFLVFFAILYYANFIFTEPNTKLGIARKALLTALIVAPYLQESKTVLAGLLLLVLTVMPGLLLIEKAKKNLVKYLIPVQLSMLLLMGIAGSLNRVQFSIKNAQEKNWLSVQQWAKQNTPVDAAFIVPPHLEGFRVESERALYGEWKDGTQMFFDPLFGNEWMRRMKMMGYAERKPFKEAYDELSEKDFEKVALEMKPAHSKVYAVVSNEKDNLNFRKIYSNSKFSVYEVSSVEVAGVHLVEDSAHELVAQSAQVGD